jgi:hypothetical protein
MHLSAFEKEALVAILEAQRRLAEGPPIPGATVWSRAQYQLAKARNLLLPSPVPGKWNVEREFEKRLRDVADGLLQRGLLRRRKLSGYGRQFKEHMGYKLHNAQSRDLRLTALGAEIAEALAPRHDDTCIHAVEDEVALEEGFFPQPSDADGTATSPCPPADADGAV